MTRGHWQQARDRFDSLAGGSVRRLAKYRAALAASLVTIRGCRTAEDAAEFIESAGYTSALNRRYAWLGDATHGPTFSDKPTGHADLPSSVLDGFRHVGSARDILGYSRSYAGDYYADADGCRTYSARVWQLPARNGAPVYLAGYQELERLGGKDREDVSGYTVLDASRGKLRTFDEKEDAARAASDLAERMAEDAQEDDNAWQERHAAEQEKEDAEEALRDARADFHNALQALCELRSVSAFSAGTIETARQRLRADVRKAREEASEAAEAVREAREKIAACACDWY